MFVRSQTLEVKYYPLPEVTFCKGCYGHFQTNGWKLTYRLQNTSSDNIVVYGSKYARDSEFSFVYGLQRRNPHICEWQYGWGSSEKRCDWKCASQELTKRKTLRPGEFIDNETLAPLEGVSPPERFTAYISASNGEPTEIFSDPFLLEISRQSSNTIPILKTVIPLCSPQVTAGASEIVFVRGLHLGTDEAEFKKLFPKVELSELREGNFRYKIAWIWDFDQDAYSVNVTFLNGRIGRIECRFKSLENKRSLPIFYPLISQKLNMPSYWERYQNGWEGVDFLIEVISNIDPTIYVSTKEFIRFQNDLNEANSKKRK